jgi:hypothetical protein
VDVDSGLFDILVQRNYDRRWSKTMLTPKKRKPRGVDMSRDLRRCCSYGTRISCAFAADRPDVSDELVFPSDVGTPLEMNNFYARVVQAAFVHGGTAKDPVS